MCVHAAELALRTAEIAEVVHDADMSLIFAGREFTELAERVRQADETSPCRSSPKTS